MMSYGGSSKPVEMQVLECVDRGLSVLGEGIKMATIWHIENTHNVKLNEILHDPNKFVDALNRMFGGASRVLIALILNEFRKTFGDLNADDFAEAVKELKRKGSVKLAKELAK